MSKFRPYSFQFKKYIATAKYLLQQNPVSEGNRRSAISRAYYASFHACLKFLKNKKLYREYPMKSPHRNVIQSLGAAGFSEAYLAMDKMRRYRNEADYSESIDSLKLKLNFTLERADWIIKKFGD